MLRPGSARNMYKRRCILGILGVMMTVLMSSCIKNQFTVEFSLDNDVSQTYRTLYYASDSKQGWIVEGALQVEKGAGSQVMPTRNPTIVYVFASNSYPATFFYVERGDKIKIEGKSSNPADWTISGNKINEELSAWRLQNRDIFEKTLSGRNSKAQEQLNRAVSKYAEANPANPVSAILLLEYYDRKDDEEGFRKAWNELKGEAAAGKWRELVSRNDMLDLPGNGDLPEQIVLNTVQTGCDTIQFGKVPVFLNFSKSNEKTYRESVSELRKLSDSAGDSASRVIANILLEPDSMQRWQNARRDSLKNVVEGWVPLGLSDPQINQLGVLRLPYIIVTDKKGKVVYRGDDVKKASETFTGLFN